MKPGEVHAIMGPNGAGKSTLGNVLAGREGYEVTAGTVDVRRQATCWQLAPEERAAAGVFLAFQYPVEIPGVNNTYFLRAALNAQRKARGEAELDSMQFLKLVREKLAVLHLKDELLHRGVNEGFSGGEKKRNEIFQMALLEPKLAILDETDSGLDIDALKAVADGVNALRSPERAFLVITHYQRLLDYIKPDVVHVLADGRIVESGGPELALRAGSRTATTGSRNRWRRRPPDERPARLAGRWLRGRRRAARALLRRRAARRPAAARAKAWKYTSLRALERRSFAPRRRRWTSMPSLLAAIPAPRMVFVNGRFDAAAQRPVGPARRRRRATAVGAAAGRRPARRGLPCPPLPSAADEPFARLNAALARDGAVVRVDAGVQVDAPLHLVHVGAPQDGGDAAWHLRHFVELREGASLQLVEHQLAAGEHAHLGNTLLHVTRWPTARTWRTCACRTTAARASLFARTDAVLAREAALLRALDLELGAALSRHELNVALEGDGASLQADGVLLADGRRHVDTRLGIDHLARDSRCDLTWRGLAGQRGRAVFHGGITIHPGADGTDADLSNKNLLLSERGGDRHPAGAGDPRRRGQGRARRHGRPARPHRAVLPALARPARTAGARAADRRVLSRGGQRHR